MKRGKRRKGSHGEDKREKQKEKKRGKIRKDNKGKVQRKIWAEKKEK